MVAEPGYPCVSPAVVPQMGDRGGIEQSTPSHRPARMLSCQWRTRSGLAPLNRRRWPSLAPTRPRRRRAMAGAGGAGSAGGALVAVLEGRESHHLAGGQMTGRPHRIRRPPSVNLGEGAGSFRPGIGHVDNAMLDADATPTPWRAPSGVESATRHESPRRLLEVSTDRNIRQRAAEMTFGLGPRGARTVVRAGRSALRSWARTMLEGTRSGSAVDARQPEGVELGVEVVHQAVEVMNDVGAGDHPERERAAVADHGDVEG